MDKIKEKKKSSKLLTIIGLLILLTAWFFVPITEHFDFTKEGETNAVKCVLVTDLHSCYYGRDQIVLIKMIDKENPDIIFLGGDIFDDNIDDDNAMIFLEDISKKYKCFYVSGNHEYWSERIDEIKEKVRNLGITVLEGDCETIEVNGRLIDVCGVDDPTRMYERQFIEQLDNAYAKTSDDHYRILLSHRPERTDLYAKYDFDLILSGHAHAGQMRIPFINVGIYAPNQGLLPKYVSGIYTLDNGSRLVVSRGLARESTPAPRFFNHPEIVMIDF